MRPRYLVLRLLLDTITESRGSVPFAQGDRQVFRTASRRQIRLSVQDRSAANGQVVASGHSMACGVTAALLQACRILSEEI